MRFAMNGKAFRDNYAKVKTEPGALWQGIHGVAGQSYTWPTSTYIAEPPYFVDFAIEDVAASARKQRAEGQNDAYSVRRARIMALFGDSITTDHISPAVHQRQLARWPVAAAAGHPQG